ncbi:MAG: hypothetical protein KAJ19_27660 [Gammaproteobacteria bacterium]|nr:hypothetical protein [Gammaproteobacteria bacterium]
MSKPNKARGESSVTIDGKAYRLCFGIWGLAQMDTQLGLSNISAIGDHLGRPASLLTILFILLEEGGEWEGKDESSLKNCGLTFEQMTEAVIDALSVGGLMGDADGDEEEDEAKN